jgi:hypothetical protein
MAITVAPRSNGSTLTQRALAATMWFSSSRTARTCRVVSSFPTTPTTTTTINTLPGRRQSITINTERLTSPATRAVSNTNNSKRAAVLKRAEGAAPRSTALRTHSAATRRRHRCRPLAASMPITAAPLLVHRSLSSAPTSRRSNSHRANKRSGCSLVLGLVRQRVSSSNQASTPRPSRTSEREQASMPQSRSSDPAKAP